MAFAITSSLPNARLCSPVCGVATLGLFAAATRSTPAPTAPAALVLRVVARGCLSDDNVHTVSARTLLEIAQWSWLASRRFGDAAQPYVGRGGGT